MRASGACAGGYCSSSAACLIRRWGNGGMDGVGRVRNGCRSLSSCITADVVAARVTAVEGVRLQRALDSPVSHSAVCFDHRAGDRLMHKMFLRAAV